MSNISMTLELVRNGNFVCHPDLLRQKLNEALQVILMRAKV